MDMLTNIDWREIFSPGVPFVEIILRGTLVYVGLFILIRVVLKREAGSVGMADLLMTVLIADAAQNAMATDYTSVTDGFILVATIVFWNFTFDWLGYRYPGFARLVRPAPLLLIKDGRMLSHNMRKEFITKEELLAQLREQGVEKLADVKEARIEGDGQVSVIQRQRA